MVNYNVISGTRQRGLKICIEEVTTRQKSNLFQSRNLLCYTKELVKRKEKEILWYQIIVSLYTIRLALSNHSSCPDIPSESYYMILHCTTQHLISKTTPHHPTLQHSEPLSYCKIWYRHHFRCLPKSLSSRGGNPFHTLFAPPLLIPISRYITSGP